jgi:hypothetical protein
MGNTKVRAALPAAEKSYMDYYCQMSYADYLRHEAAGTLETADYSTHDA